MTTWNEWFAHLDGRLDTGIAGIGGLLPEIHEFIQGVEQSRSDLELISGRSRSPALDDLSSMALFAGYLEESAKEGHYRAASQLYSQGRHAAWFPAALPNSEDSRVAKRVATAAAAGSTSRIALCKRP